MSTTDDTTPIVNSDSTSEPTESSTPAEVVQKDAKVSRTVTKSVAAKAQSEGAGATVRRSIGTHQLRNFTPFLMLDHFDLKQGSGFPDHPHRGQITVTYMLQGSVDHEDFAGNKGRIGPGSLQWMTAGKGIVHAEMPVHENGSPDPQGLQLWIDLPKENRMVPPDYQELKAEQIPSAHPSPDVEIRVISGETEGNEEEGKVVSPVKTVAGCWYFDVKLAKKGATVFQPIPEGWNAFMYTLSGQLSVGPPSSTNTHNSNKSSSVYKPYHTLVLSSENTQNGVQITSNSDIPGRVILIAGKPLDQEIVQYGPFISDTRGGIEQAFVDYSMGRNGFENAGQWKSEIGRKLM